MEGFYFSVKAEKKKGETKNATILSTEWNYSIAQSRGYTAFVVYGSFYFSVL